jgi:hypothetical protein
MTRRMRIARTPGLEEAGASIRGVTDSSGEVRVPGIVGGTGPESTVDYYRSLVATWRRRRPDGTYPRVIIDSIEAGRVFQNLAASDLAAVGRDLGAAIDWLLGP